MADDKHGAMTPVPRAFLNTLSDDLSEIKRDTRSTNEAIVELRTDMRATKGRVKKLENHIPCEAVAEVKDDTKKLILKVNTAEANIAEQSTDLDAITKKDSKRVYWLLGAAVVVVGAVAGWLTTMATMEANVDTLQSEQTNIRDEIKGLRSATFQHTEEVQEATEAVQSAATEMQNGKEHTIPVDIWYSTLSEEDKRLLRRRGINVPIQLVNDLPVEAAAPAENSTEIPTYAR